jgi:hypothetical protein
VASGGDFRGGRSLLVDPLLTLLQAIGRDRPWFEEIGTGDLGIHDVMPGEHWRFGLVRATRVLISRWLVSVRVLMGRAGI